MKCPKKNITFSKMSYELGVDCQHLIDQDGWTGYCKRPEYYKCIEDIYKPVRLSNSSVKLFIMCRQLYYLSAIRGIYTYDHMKNPAIKMGALWDMAIQKICGNDVDMNKMVEQYEIGDYDIAKVRALYRAAKELNIDFGTHGDCQHRFAYDISLYHDERNPNDKLVVSGIFDRYYADEGYFVESKLSARPDNYFDIYFIQSQIGTYFLANPDLKYVVMEVTRTPQLRSTGGNRDESAEQLEGRIYQDVLARPSWYFIGWDPATRKYGKKFYRSEFDLDEIYKKYYCAAREINLAMVEDAFYKNDMMCSNMFPGIPCDMYGVCRCNTVAENIYGIRQIPDRVLEEEAKRVERLNVPKVALEDNSRGKKKVKVNKKGLKDVVDNLEQTTLDLG